MVPDFTKAVFEEHVSMHEQIMMELNTAMQIQQSNPLSPVGSEEGPPGIPGPSPEEVPVPGPDVMPENQGEIGEEMPV
jgi:hypothetical protein